MKWYFTDTIIHVVFMIIIFCFYLFFAAFIHCLIQNDENPWFFSGFSIIFFSDTICVSLQSKQYKKDVGTSTTLKHRKKDTSTKEVFHSYPTLEKTIISIILFCVKTISQWLIMLLKLPPFHSLDVIFSLNWNHLKTIGKQIYK